MCKPPLLKNSSNRYISRPVKRSIDDLQVLCLLPNDLRMNAERLDSSDIRIIDLLPDILKEPLLSGLLFGHGLYRIGAAHQIYLIHDVFVVRRGDLGSVLPVDLVPVIFPRVMAGRNDNPGFAVQVAQGKGQLRSWAQRSKAVGSNAVGAKDQSSFHGKFRRHPSGIKGNDRSFLFSLFFQNIIGQSLRRPADRIDVHTIRAGSDDPPKTAGPEFQILIEAVMDFLRIARNLLQFLLRSLVITGTFQPLTILYKSSVFHFYYSYILAFLFQFLKHGAQDHCTKIGPDCFAGKDPDPENMEKNTGHLKQQDPGQTMNSQKRQGLWNLGRCQAPRIIHRSDKGILIAG